MFFLTRIYLCCQVLKDCLKQIKLHGDGEEEPGEKWQKLLN